MTCCWQVHDGWTSKSDIKYTFSKQNDKQSDTQITTLGISKYRVQYNRKKKHREKKKNKKHDFLNDFISGGPYKCQDHPAGERKGPCYPESCWFYFSDSSSHHSLKRSVSLLPASWLIGEQLEAFLTWQPGCIWIRSWLDQIAVRNPGHPVCPPVHRLGASS